MLICRTTGHVSSVIAYSKLKSIFYCLDCKKKSSFAVSRKDILPILFMYSCPSSSNPRSILLQNTFFVEYFELILLLLFLGTVQKDYDLLVVGSRMPRATIMHRKLQNGLIRWSEIYEPGVSFYSKGLESASQHSHIRRRTSGQFLMWTPSGSDLFSEVEIRCRTSPNVVRTCILLFLIPC